MSQGSFLALKMGSKLVPNRIIDAEGVTKPLDRHLGGYHSALGAILGALGRLKWELGTPTFQQGCSNSLRRGGGERINLSQELGMRGFDSKKDLPRVLHALRHRGLGGFS